MKVTDPDGQVWRVTRRWVPWRARLRDARDLTDMPSDFGDDPAFAVALFLTWLLIVVLSLLAPLVLSVLFLPVEVALLALVLPFAVLGRVFFGRRWHVEVRRGWKPWTEVMAGDWQSSTLRIHDLADAVRRGEAPARTL